jgi:hypothetical protein
MTTTTRSDCSQAYENGGPEAAGKDWCASVSGMLNKQIADELMIAAHRHELMLKMGAGSLAELVRSADRSRTMTEQLDRVPCRQYRHSHICPQPCDRN